MLPVRVHAVINQKGGVGKTTTVANLGAALAARGVRVCLIDLDPQAHLTLHFGIEPGSTPASVYDVLVGGTSLRSVLCDAAPGLQIAPSMIDLAAAELELATTVGREQVLRDHLRDGPPDADLVLIDCPPSLGLLTLNALAAADEVLIPLQPHFLALQGLGKLLETVSLVQRRVNPRLRVAGIVLCMYESATRLAAEVASDLAGFFDSARAGQSPWAGARIFRTVIRRNIKLAESPSHGKTIFDYEPASHGAADYAALAEEFLGALDMPSSSAAPEAPPPTPPPADAPAPAPLSGPPHVEPAETTPAPQAPAPGTQPAPAEARPQEGPPADTLSPGAEPQAAPSDPARSE